MYSVETLDEESAKKIAEAYIKGEKDPPRMAKILDVSHFDLNLLMHPMVRGFIVEFQRLIRQTYTLEDHVAKLKEIRDGALDDENFKVALASETQIGKAVGLYDPRPLGDDGGDGIIDPTTLTTDELRRRLAKQIGATIPPVALPSREIDDDLDADDVEGNMV